MLPLKGLTGSRAIHSGSCGLADLVVVTRVVPGEVLDLTDGWAGRWSAAWRVSGSEVVCPVRDLGSFPVPGCEPVRRFSWSRAQRHRPGLQFMVSTGLHHGFESLEEARLLLALDFAGAVTEVICQPFRLRFATADGPVEHIPDVLAVAADGTWLIDVRPSDRIGGGRPGEVRGLGGGGACLRVALSGGVGLGALRDGDAGYLVLAAAAAG